MTPKKTTKPEVERPEAKRPEFIDCTSVEQIPRSKARVLFTNKTTEIFRDYGIYDTLMTPDGKEYKSWGGDDQMPYNIINLIEKDETVSTCQVFNAEVCYGSGLTYDTCNASPEVARKVEDFLLDNPLPDYFLGVCQDMMHFNFAVSVIILNAEGSEIVELHRKPACYCRFAPADPKTGKLTKIIFGPFRDTQPNDKFEEIELLNPRSPWRDLQQRMGRRASMKDKPTSCRKFAILSRFPGVDSPYYPIPHYAALFTGEWYNIKKLIGQAKMSKLQNAAPIKYVIEISQRFWDNLFMNEKISSPEQKRKRMAEKKREMMEFLTDHENSGSALFTGKSISIDGKGESADVTVVPIDSKTKEGGDWESDIAEAVNMVCFTMRVHSNLVGSVPGKSQTNNSGSDKRELYTIAQALKKPYRDLLFVPHQIIIRYNGWEGVRPDCPFIQLTTLDEHKDCIEVTANSQKDEN
ncbi:MAG: hypothetical protein ACI4AK_09380 [Lepagella sp.]